jgi:hypothetical protein
VLKSYDIDREADHLPDPATLVGALDLFAFCFLVIFANVFDFRSYTNAQGEPLKTVEIHDQNGIAVEERVNMCQARGVCLELLRWWNAQYSTYHADGGSQVGATFTTHLLVTQAAALLKYKRCALQDNREGAPGCTVILLTQQIENVLSIIPGEVPGVALQEWRRRVCNTSVEEDLKLGFSCEEWKHVQIVEREPMQTYRKHSLAEMLPDENLTPSQRHPKTFFPLVIPLLTRPSWNTLVLVERPVRCGRGTKGSALNAVEVDNSVLDHHVFK